MRNVIVNTKTLLKAYGVCGDLLERPSTVPGIAVFSGKTGAGKTTTVASAIGRFGAVYIRANSYTTHGSLLDMLCFELGIERAQRNIVKFQAIAAHLRESPRPLFIDEADYLTTDRRMLEGMRDLHDESGVPVVLIAMDGFDSKLTKHPQFARRISQRLEFKHCDFADATKVAKELCEVDVAPDLLALMHKRTKGSIGLMVVALALFEKHAKGHQWKAIDAKQWGDKPMFMGDGAN